MIDEENYNHSYRSTREKMEMTVNCQSNVIRLIKRMNANRSKGKTVRKISTREARYNLSNEI